MKRYQKTLLQVIVLIGVVVLAFYLAELSTQTESIKNTVHRFGYIGIFVVAIIGGFNLLIPVPAAAFMPLILAAGLKFWPAVTIIVLGVTLADMTAFIIGKLSHNITYASADSQKMLTRLQKMRERYKFAPMLVLFLFASFAPIPNEVILVPFGFMGYRFNQVFPFVLAGNLLFTILYSSVLINVFQSL